MIEVLNLLQGADRPLEDQRNFIKAQILFWLIGATDGHAKNFSVFLGPSGRYRMTPLYDVLSGQPSLEQRQIERKQMKLAMSVGDSRHYRLEEIEGRHFVQTARRARLPESLVVDVLREVAEIAPNALATTQGGLPADFPAIAYESVTRAVNARLSRIQSRLSVKARIDVPNLDLATRSV